MLITVIMCLVVIFLYYFIAIFLDEITRGVVDYKIVFETTIKLVILLTLIVILSVHNENYKELEYNYKKLKMEINE